MGPNSKNKYNQSREDIKQRNEEDHRSILIYKERTTVGCQVVTRKFHTKVVQEGESCKRPIQLSINPLKIDSPHRPSGVCH